MDANADNDQQPPPVQPPELAPINAQGPLAPENDVNDPAQAHPPAPPHAHNQHAGPAHPHPHLHNGFIPGIPPHMGHHPHHMLAIPREGESFEDVTQTFRCYRSVPSGQFWFHPYRRVYIELPRYEVGVMRRVGQRRRVQAQPVHPPNNAWACLRSSVISIGRLLHLSFLGLLVLISDSSWLWNLIAWYVSYFPLMFTMLVLYSERKLCRMTDLLHYINIMRYRHRRESISQSNYKNALRILLVPTTQCNRQDSPFCLRSWEWGGDGDLLVSQHQKCRLRGRIAYVFSVRINDYWTPTIWTLHTYPQQQEGSSETYVSVAELPISAKASVFDILRSEVGIASIRNQNV